MTETKQQNTERLLAQRLLKQEELRTYYWTKIDHFVEMRMGWRASVVRHLFHILPRQSVLEIGAGNGVFSKALGKATRHECPITLAVFNNANAEQLKKELDPAHFEVIYLKEFPGPLAGRSFDVAVANHMLEDESRNLFLYNTKSLLKPDGGLILFEPNPWNPYFQLRRIIRAVFPFLPQRGDNPASLNRIYFLTTLSEIGYVKINAMPYDFLFPPIPKFMLWPLRNLSLILENCPYIRNMAGSLMVFARNSGLGQEREQAIDLCDHPMFFGKVSFVIPCHNEEMNVTPLVENIYKYFEKYLHEILIVDDNSRDATAAVAEELHKPYPAVRVIKRSMPNGVGRALRDGLSAASGDFVLIMDSDFQHILPEMRDLFDGISQGADIAIGSRFSRESVLVNYAFSKIVANRAFHILANMLFRKRFRDISNNLKLMRASVAKKMVIEANDFAANVETGLKPLLLGYKCALVPISWVNRSVDMGLSTFKLMKTGPNYWRILFKIFLRQVFRRSCQLETDPLKKSSGSHHLYS
jgi:2-polyprenyl-3-methyl-5-hydroxy-6-metoxy-1,4-benzoquinol methylase